MNPSLSGQIWIVILQHTVHVLREKDYSEVHLYSLPYLDQLGHLLHSD